MNEDGHIQFLYYPPTLSDATPDPRRESGREELADAIETAARAVWLKPGHDIVTQPMPAWVYYALDGLGAFDAARAGLPSRGSPFWEHVRARLASLRPDGESGTWLERFQVEWSMLDPPPSGRDLEAGRSIVVSWACGGAWTGGDWRAWVLLDLPHSLHARLAISWMQCRNAPLTDPAFVLRRGLTMRESEMFRLIGPATSAQLRAMEERGIIARRRFEIGKPAELSPLGRWLAAEALKEWGGKSV